MFKRHPHGFVPLMIMEMMEKGPTYGYEIIQKAQEISGNHWDPSYGTVYGCLDRLEQKGVIEPANLDRDGDRQYYRLTEKGREKLQEGRRWKADKAPDFADMILGLLHAYRHLEGKEEFNSLLQKIQREFGETNLFSPSEICSSQEEDISD